MISSRLAAIWASLPATTSTTMRSFNIGSKMAVCPASFIKDESQYNYKYRKYTVRIQYICMHDIIYIYNYIHD